MLYNTYKRYCKSTPTASRAARANTRNVLTRLLSAGRAAGRRLEHRWNKTRESPRDSATSACRCRAALADVDQYRPRVDEIRSTLEDMFEISSEKLRVSGGPPGKERERERGIWRARVAHSLAPSIAPREIHRYMLLRKASAMPGDKSLKFNRVQQVAHAGGETQSRKNCLLSCSSTAACNGPRTP